MRDNEDLRGSCEFGKPTPEFRRGLAADARVYLVEDEGHIGRFAAPLRNRELEGEHQTAQFAA